MCGDTREMNPAGEVGRRQLELLADRLGDVAPLPKFASGLHASIRLGCNLRLGVDAGTLALERPVPFVCRRSPAAHVVVANSVERHRGHLHRSLDRLSENTLQPAEADRFPTVAHRY